MRSTQMWNQFQSLADYYLQELDKYTWEQFNRKPSPTQWSMGEMYNHIIETGFLQIDSLKASAQAPENRSTKKTWVGKLVYLIGAIPPIRAKVPKSAEHTAFPPASKEELRDKMRSLRQNMEEALSIADSASPWRKFEHPYFGFINAKEWYHHIVMHFAHHLRQKKRIDAFLAESSPRP